ncbi:zinc-dependent metalloprotease [Maribacter confluentis]|uniref:Zinc-dependent metalloprotease n=1 Tax=Maribacter confluentis TaxID=1656093 RepID=A0ABT8RWX2_9FLAO|nr:zinc-dependent metalloprotease [Maribacter confluentis]MDO1514400.1 zinc-dependent metalloprotease [Maribacter confluentis]MDO1514829.1 zinc-dependent metalloprotease [Maribacter confluentis]
MKKNYLPLFILLLVTTNVMLGQFSDKKNDLKKYDGFFDFFYEEKTDKIFLEVKELNKEFLYVYSLSSGIGSNDIGLDRGQLGDEQVVYFKKAGGKLLLVQPNLKFRANTENELERISVEQAFAKSILYGFPIVEDKNGTYIIDITDFLMQDAHGVANRLKRTKQGAYSLDKSKSAMAMERTKAFPQNVEFDVTLTFKGEPAGSYIRSVAPNANLITVAEHHSFIALPDDGYEPREFDPRSGASPFSYYDYATPVESSILKRFIRRHRLEKKDPTAKLSEAVEPIIYYLDNGTPEPVRTALLEGGRWWNQAFEAIGYKDAFQVKILPDDADPLDVRYNVIQWVHRSTRGWSYGSSITDPRTGEIMKGHVSLGSLRIRQDFLIAQALMKQPFAERDDNYEPMLQMAIARIRQLSAHEIGHTLGFAHNYAASTTNKASVMDYPHPQFTLQNGEVEFSNAYENGIGEWDKVSVAYSYETFPEGVNEKEELDKILDQATANGLRFITDQDARPQGSAHVLAHLWDNGTNVSKELDEMLKIRKTAINNFSENNIRTGEAFAVLEDVFVPLYFFHRYQTEAVAKLIGGLEYNYAVKGDGQNIVEIADKDMQKDALTSILNTVNAEVIAIPKDKLKLFPPRAFGHPRTRESINGKTGLTFDALSAVETAADMTLGFLLHPERASRLIQQKSIDQKNIGLQEVLDELVANTLMKKHKDTYLNEAQVTINFRVLTHIMNLANHPNVAPQVNAITNAQLRKISQNFAPEQHMDPIKGEMVKRIKDFYDHPELFKVIPSPAIPDGSPIGMDCFH